MTLKGTCLTSFQVLRFVIIICFLPLNKKYSDVPLILVFEGQKKFPFDSQPVESPTGFRLSDSVLAAVSFKDALVGA